MLQCGANDKTIMEQLDATITTNDDRFIWNGADSDSANNFITFIKLSVLFILICFLLKNSAISCDFLDCLF